MHATTPAPGPCGQSENGICSSRSSRSRQIGEELEHLFAAMRRVADQLLPSWIDHEIQDFERNLSDQDRTIIGNRNDVNRAAAALHRQLDGLVDLDIDEPTSSSHTPFMSGLEP